MSSCPASGTRLMTQSHRVDLRKTRRPALGRTPCYANRSNLCNIRLLA